MVAFANHNRSATAVAKRAKMHVEKAQHVLLMYFIGFEIGTVRQPIDQTPTNDKWRWPILKGSYNTQPSINAGRPDSFWPRKCCSAQAGQNGYLLFCTPTTNEKKIDCLYRKLLSTLTIVCKV